MRGIIKLAAPILALLVASLACAKPRPIAPARPVPAGEALFLFTRKVVGTVDLTVDGTRVPVAEAGKKRKWRQLRVSGLAPGRHRFLLQSPLEAFGPDQVDLELTGSRGEYRVLFAQDLNSVLYGKPDPTPAAPGLPGVRATLEP